MARRLVAPKTARSDVWNYFGFEADESGTITDAFRRFVWCRLCNTQLLFSGNTTNLSAHIARCRKISRGTAGKTKSTSQKSTKFVNRNEKQQDVSDVGQTSEGQQDTEDDGGDFSTLIQEDDSASDEHQYLLKWKHHQNNQQEMLAKLLERESFCDVMIACEEKIIRAHKLILSACSSYFEMVLSRYEDRTPVIILKDVKYRDMFALVRFMYKGEINIDQSQLPSLLETADALKIKGLSDVYNETRRIVAKNRAKRADNIKLVEEPQQTKSDEQLNSDEKSDADRRVQTRRRTLSPLEDPKTVKIPRRDTNVEDPATLVDEPAEQSEQQDSATDEGDYSNIVRLPDFLKSHGNYHDFWKKPWVLKALKAVSDKKITLRNCSDLLGVGYNILYSRYRQLHGCLKEAPGDTFCTKRSYILKLVRSPGDGEGRKIVLRREQISSGVSLSLRSHNENDSIVSNPEGGNVLKVCHINKPKVSVVYEEGATQTLVSQKNSSSDAESDPSMRTESEDLPNQCLDDQIPEPTENTVESH